MVILITGLCQTNCFYCPISQKKIGTDRIFADEWKLDNENDTEKLIKEAEYINAKGAGITGGDPLVVWKRTKKYICLLKEYFGTDFHIHLYTSAQTNTEKIKEIIDAGLDEIRFHPKQKYWNKLNESEIGRTIEKTTKHNLDVAIEIPVIPSKEEEIISLIKWADKNKLKWVNLNELEFSETNYNALAQKGYKVKEEISAAVQNSAKTAQKVMNNIKSLDLKIGVHYCSVSFKDGIQLTNRIKRRAKNIAKEYEVISEDGTLLKGAICKDKTPLNETLKHIKEKYEIPSKYIKIDHEKNRIEIGLWILEEIAPDLKKQKYSCFMIEEYPTADRLEVEKIPMPF